MSDEPKLVVAPTVEKLERLATSHGALAPGSGLLTGVIALVLAILSLLAVIGFHFPAYLSTPELRHVYDVQTLRYALFGAMVVSGALALVNIVLGRRRWLAASAFAIVALAEALGGPTVPIGDFPDHTPYVGLDFFVLDLLGSTLVFVFLEKLFPLRRDQPIFRAEWQNDLTHFFVNHLIVGLVLLITNRVVHGVFGWAVSDTVQSLVTSLPFLLQLFLVILVADLVQYWTHRAYHEVPFLWRFHSVHHSAEHMDWLAGSRQHLLELIATRIMVLAPIFVLGFSQRVIDVYVIVVGFQAVFNHANVDVRLGPLRYLIVTPNFHHWHHSRDTEAIDRNYAAHFAFLDYLFGTAVTADRKWPNRYGVVGDYVPLGFLKQLAFPFVGSTESRERPTLAPGEAAWTKPSAGDSTGKDAARSEG
ncbi:sterol desaturase family protein [Sandaracinus amylolyticus]|uniref:sterol desaturase family protein n=1 Tax=Sandaracinus amylolyticus TaxID=927083 RepID=UPI001F2B47F3|nr:sterol desaturase family protein [Sandaracinus amylolyticus]